MIPVEKNKEYEIKIEDTSSEGSGVGRIDGYTVFVDGAISGDYVRAMIIKVKSGYAVGKLMEIIQPSSIRCQPKCDYFDKCGGCQLMCMDYVAQLKYKRKIVENNLKRIGGFENITAEPTIGMDKPYRYRNKAVFPVGDDKSGVVCGFYAQRSHRIVPMNDCMISGEYNKSVIAAVLEYMRECNVASYDEKSGKGLVRRIFTRRGHISGEIMVVISANADNLPKSDVLVEKLTGACGDIASIILNVNKKRTNLVLGDKNITLWGKDKICDTLFGISYEISPHSFYQINPIQTEKLYSKAIELAELSGAENVLDIYCGIGTISLSCAKNAKNVVGVEIVEQAIADAKKNAVCNNITNAEFYAGSAENIVPKLIDEGLRPDVVLIDPPRKGSDEKTLDAIIKASPDRIVYVSCNSATLARDARYLAQHGYEIKHIAPVDMFPHTMHVETVCLLSKLKSTHHIEVELKTDELDLTSAESKATYDEIKAYVKEHTGLTVSSLNIAQVKQKCDIIERENYNKARSKDSRQPKCTKEKEGAIVEALGFFKMI